MYSPTEKRKLPPEGDSLRKRKRGKNDGPDDPMKGEDPNGAALTVDEGISDYSHAESAAPVGALDSNKADELAKSPSEMAAENEPAEKINPVDDVFDNGSFKKGGKK